MAQQSTDKHHDAVMVARRRRLVEHLHQLGPAPLNYFLREIENGASIPDHLERYAEIHPGFVRALGGDQHAPILHMFDGGKRS
jgi:hypothetical protein